MTSAVEVLIPHMAPFLMVAFRLGGLFMFAPMFGSSVLPMRVKVLLALALAVCVYPGIPAQSGPPMTLITLPIVLGSEMLIGIAIGYAASLPLLAMQIGGQMMGHQLGLGLAHVFNPEFNEQVEVLSQFLFLVALAAFLLLNGHHALLHALASSFHAVPLGGYAPDGGLVALTVGMLSASFELGVRVAAPLLCLIFLETIAMGFVARTVPQLNILSLGFPLRITLGLFLLIGLVAMMFTTFGDAMTTMLNRLVFAFSP